MTVITPGANCVCCCEDGSFRFGSCAVKVTAAVSKTRTKECKRPLDMANRAGDFGWDFVRSLAWISKIHGSMLPDCSLRLVFSLTFTLLNYLASAFSVFWPLESRFLADGCPKNLRDDAIWRSESENWSLIPASMVKVAIRRLPDWSPK